MLAIQRIGLNAIAVLVPLVWIFLSLIFKNYATLVLDTYDIFIAPAIISTFEL
jgi:hypothetical protein